jgi:hypothetical protein
MEAGHKKKTFFWEKLLRVCVTNGGEVWGLGVRGEGRWKKCRKRRRCVESLKSRKFEKVILSLLKFETLPLELISARYQMSSFSLR